MTESKRRRLTSSAASAVPVPATMLPPSTTAAATFPISDLPDHLLHNVISFLPPETASKLCIVSKRFYSAWNSTPSLSFHHYSSPAGGDNNSAENRNRFFNYIHSTFARRTPGVALQKFRIHAAAPPRAATKTKKITTYHDRRIDAAIDYALSPGLRELDLALGEGRRIDRRYQFPHRILTAANNSSLTALRLSGFDLDPTRPVLLMDYPLLTALSLSRNSGIKALEISCPSLKSLEIISCPGLKSLTLLDPQTTSNLESFSLEKYAGELDISGCGSLKELKLCRVAAITGEWIESNVPNFEPLKSLELNSCCRLKWMEVRHEGLERLVLDECDELNQIQVVAGNLAEFNYSSTSSSLMPRELGLGGSGRLVARLGLPSGVFKVERFQQSSEFLKSFGHCRKLTLEAIFVQDLSIDESLRKGKAAPMYDLKSLEVKISTPGLSVSGIVELVESLLWLAPQVNELSLNLFSEEKRTLKLSYYAQPEPESEKQLLCCRKEWPIKCWRHSLREVTMNNFKPQEKLDLLEFFMSLAAKLEAVYDNEGRIFNKGELINYQQRPSKQLYSRKAASASSLIQHRSCTV